MNCEQIEQTVNEELRNWLRGKNEDGWEESFWETLMGICARGGRYEYPIWERQVEKKNKEAGTNLKAFRKGKY